MQHRLLSAILLASLVVGLPLISAAERLEHGTFEWSFSGSGSRENKELAGAENGDETRVALHTELGYFITPVFELAVSVGGSHTSLEPQGLAREKFNSYDLGTRLIANVPNESAVTPYAYLGAGISAFSGDEDHVGSETASTFPSMGIGARYFLGKAVSFNLQFDYSQTSNAQGMKDANSDVITWSFGFSTFLRRK